MCYVIHYPSRCCSGTENEVFSPPPPTDGLLTVSEIYQAHTDSYFPDQTQAHWGQLLSYTPEVEQMEPEGDNASSRF